MLVYKNGLPWGGYLDSLGKTFKLKHDVDFELSSDYSGYKNINDVWVKSFPNYVGCPVEYSFQDKVSGESGLVRYVENKGDRLNHQTNTTVPIFTPDIIAFGQGRIRCRANNLAFYWFMINHPDNESNRIYDGSAVGKLVAEQNRLTRGRPFIFREINIDRDLEKKIIISDKAIDVKYILSKQTSEEELREIYAYCGQPNSATVDLRSISLYLRNEADKDPEKIQKIIKSDNRSIKAVAMRAIEAEVIAFGKKGRVWKFKDVDDIICTVPSGINEEEFLVEWLRNKDEGSQVQDTIKKIMVAKEKGEDISAITGAVAAS